ncbi:phage tail terminator-like protein [Pseudomonas sp.]|uniref:phage tail terminator-like protein n=2 Tax=Pseudomonas sp. TaxID=306 RepID=UPI003FD82EF1
MSDRLIRSSFEGRLKTWAGARVPALPIAYEDVAFTAPADGSTYLRAFLLPANTDSQDLEGKHTAYRGIFQVSIVTKAGIGRGTASLIAEEIAALFPNNLELVKSGLSVFVRSPMSTSTAQQGDTTSSLPLSFQYRADTF